MCIYEHPCVKDINEFSDDYPNELRDKLSREKIFPLDDYSIDHCVKRVQIRSFFGPYFPVFGLNTEIYSVNIRAQSEYRKIRIRKNSVFEHFSRSELF